MTVETTGIASGFLADMFAASTVAPIYVASLPNADANGEPGERHVATRDRNDIEAFLRKWDRKNRALYFSVGTVKPGATERSRDTIAEIAGLHADIDFKDLDLAPTEIEKKLAEVALLPSLVVASGNGLHAYWILSKALAATPETVERVEALLRLLADYLGADPKVAHVASFMRLPGSHNTKGGAWTEVIVIANRPLRYSLDDLEDWLTVASPIIRRRAKGTNGAAANEAPLDPWTAVASRFAHKPPIDVEARLAAMTYQGAGDASIHATQVSVSAALLNRGHSIDETVDILLTATRAAAGAYSERWNWRREERAIRRMCESWLAKHPEVIEQIEANVSTGSAASSAHGEQPEDAAHQDSKPQREARRPLILAYAPRPLAEIPRRQWLHAGHYIAASVVMTIAPGGYGKTSLVLANAIEMATGRGLLGPPPAGGPCRVAVFNAEDWPIEVERRVAALCIRYAIDPFSLRENLFLGRPLGGGERLAALDRKGNVVLNASMWNELTQFIADQQIDCLIVDPLVGVHAIPESDNGAMEVLIKSGFGELAARTNCAIELSAHTRKPAAGQQGELTADDNRGASAVVNAARSVRVLNRMTREEAELPKIAPEDQRHYLRVSRDKTNLAPPGKASWIHLTSIELPNGDATRPGDRVQAVEAWSYPQAFETITTADMQWIRAAVAAGTYRRDPRSPEWVGLLLIGRLGLDPADPGDRKRVGEILKVWFANRVLATEERQDEHRHVREYVVPGNWEEGGAARQRGKWVDDEESST